MISHNTIIIYIYTAVVLVENIHLAVLLCFSDIIIVLFTTEAAQLSTTDVYTQNNKLYYSTILGLYYVDNLKFIIKSLHVIINVKFIYLNLNTSITIIILNIFQFFEMHKVPSTVNAN